MTHSPNCEEESKAQIKECYTQAAHHQAAMRQELEENGAPNVTSLVLGLNVLTYMHQAEKTDKHLLEHQVDRLEARVLELEMNIEELVKQGVKNYFDPRLDNENL